MPLGDSLRALLGQVGDVLRAVEGVADALDQVQVPSPAYPQPDCASLLGLDQDELDALPADEARAVVRRAYRQRARGLHPDAPGGSAAAFEGLTAARDALLADLDRAG